MASQGTSKKEDIIVVVSDDDKQVKKRHRHRHRKRKKHKKRSGNKEAGKFNGGSPILGKGTLERPFTDRSRKQIAKHSTLSDQIYVKVKEEDVESMARKKSTQRKFKAATKPQNNNEAHAQERNDSIEKSSEELADSHGKDNEMPSGHVKDEQANAQKYLRNLLASEGRAATISEESSTGTTTLPDQTAPSSASSDQNITKESTTVIVAPVKVKEEPKPGFESGTCSQTIDNTRRYTSEKELTVPVPLVKVKQEGCLKETNSELNSCTPYATSPAMDLGSHLQQSLNALPCTELTWTQLMEAKNLPKMYEPGKSQTDQVVKNSNSVERPPVSSGSVHTESSTKPRKSSAEDDVLSVSENRRSPAVSGTSAVASSNRFSSTSGNSGKIILSEGSGASNILDLSKKTLPPAIRRVLASKYGIPKRNEESHSAGVVPNFNKSRSRFTVATKKVATDYEVEPADKIRTAESPPSMVFEREKDSSECKSSDHGPAKISRGFSNSAEPSHTVSQGKTFNQPQSKFSSNSLVLENRESNLSPFSQYLALDYRSRKDMSDNLKNHGLLDLGSHYGDLLKDSSPSVTPRSSSRSPRIIELARSPKPQDTAEPMIDLGNYCRVNERGGPQHRRTGEAMINLSNMEKPKSPRSPSYKSISFAGRSYRPNDYTGQNYRSSASTRNPRSTASPGLNSGPPIELQRNRSSSPGYQASSGPFIDLGSFGKGSDFRSMVSSRSPENEIVLRPSRVTLGGEKRNQKRALSVDSERENDLGKRLRLERNDDCLEVKKPEDGIKLNIGGLLKLEQEEQKYIQDLSVVQAQVTNVGFKIQKMQQELDALQCSETEIKRLISVVRTKRLRILRDAQDRQGSVGTREIYEPELPHESESLRRRTLEGGQGEDFVERRVKYDRRSPGFRNSYHNELSDGFGGTSETKRKVEMVPGIEAEQEDLRRQLEISKTRRVEIPDEISDRFDSYHDNHLPRNRRMSSELVSYSAERHSFGKFARLDLDESGKAFQDKTPQYIERYEDPDDYSMMESGDSMLLVQHHRFPRSRHERKGSSCVVLEEIESRYPSNAFGSGKEVFSSDGSKQYLGCLEISSTTEEPLTEDSEGHKEILAEKERESLENNLRGEQERISSTVPSLDDKKDTEVSSAREVEFSGHTAAVCYVLPYKGKLFSASADRTAKSFDLKTGECITTFQGHQKAVNCLQISNDGGNRDRLFTGSNDQTVRAYGVKSGACTHKFSFRGRVMCLHIAFGKLFVGLSSGFVAVLDLKTNKCIDQFSCHEMSGISCISSASTGQKTLLCTGSFDATITLHDQLSGLLVRTIADHKLTVLCMQVVENIMFSGSADTSVQSHDINTGQLIRSYTGHSMSVSGLQALGGVLVTSSLDRIVRCFDIETGDLLQLYGGNSDMIFSLSVFSDMIYTGCRDGKLSGMRLDLRKYHCCKWGKCSLKFGLLNHLKQHVQDHVNQTIGFDSCLWEGCFHKFPRGKQLDVIQAAMEHIISHVPDTEN